MGSRGGKKLQRSGRTSGGPGKNRWVRGGADKPLSRETIFIAAAVLLVVRILLSLLPSYKIDMDGYRAWSLFLADKGFNGFYENFHVVYAPAYMYLLWLTGKLSSIFSMNAAAHVFFIKLWAVLSDIAGGYLIYLIGRKYGKERKGFIVGLLYALNPAIFFNSSVWGQFDSIPATMLLGAIYCFNFKKKAAAAILFGISVLTKPQSAMLAPIILILFLKDFSWRKPEEWKKILFTVVGGAAAYAVIVLPFSSGRPFYWIIDLYLTSGGDYPYATANGFNLWTLLGGQTVDDSSAFLGLTYGIWSMIFMGIAAILSLYFLLARSKSVMMLYFSPYFLCFAVFMVGSRMHERYLFPALIFLMLCILWDTRLWIPALILSGCHLANQWYVYDLARRENFWVANNDTFAAVTAFVTLAVMAYSLYYIFRLISKKQKPMGVSL